MFFPTPVGTGDQAVSCAVEYPRQEGRGRGSRSGEAAWMADGSRVSSTAASCSSRLSNSGGVCGSGAAELRDRERPRRASQERSRVLVLWL